MSMMPNLDRSLLTLRHPGPGFNRDAFFPSDGPVSRPNGQPTFAIMTEVRRVLSNRLKHHGIVPAPEPEAKQRVALEVRFLEFRFTEYSRQR